VKCANNANLRPESTAKAYSSGTTTLPVSLSLSLSRLINWQYRSCRKCVKLAKRDFESRGTLRDFFGKSTYAIVIVIIVIIIVIIVIIVIIIYKHNLDVHCRWCHWQSI
jgi:hypothetical protein